MEGHGAPWRVALFGAKLLTGAQGQVFSTRSSAQSALIALVASTPDLTIDRQGLSKQVLGAHATRLAHNFAVLLTRTRNKLRSTGADILFADNSSVWLDPRLVTTDLAELRSRLRVAKRSQEPLESVSHVRQALASLSGEALVGLDHGAVDSLRESLSREVLQAVLLLAEMDPLGQRGFVLDTMERLRLDKPQSSACLVSVMGIYGALGLRKEVVAAFAQYEDDVAVEYGERVGKRIEDAMEQSLSTAEALAERRWLPPTQGGSFGREHVLEAMLRLVTGLWRVVNLAGPPGVGKSHLLREFASLVGSSKPTVFWTVGKGSFAAYCDALDYRRPEIVILDDLDTVGTDKALEYVAEAKVAMCYVSTMFPFDREEAYLLPIEPLPVGDRSAPGPAMRLLAHRVSEYANRPSSDLMNDLESHTIAEACDGNPRALEWAAKSIASVGTKPTFQIICQDLNVPSEANDDISTRFTLQTVVARTISKLPPQAQHVARVLANVDAPVPIPMLSCVFGLKEGEIQAVLSSGLLKIDANGLVSWRKHLVEVFRRRDKTLMAPSEWSEFEGRFSDWLQSIGAEDEINLAFADTLNLADALALRWALSGQIDRAFRLFNQSARWHGQHRPPRELINLLSLSLWSGSKPVDDNWGHSVVNVAAAAFHAGDYELMGQVLDSAINSPSFDTLPIQLRCRALTQKGLQLAAMRDYEAAEKYYELVIAEATVENQRALECHAWYNLGCACELQGRYGRAVACFESAAACQDERVDPRIIRFIELGIARMKDAPDRPEAALANIEDLIERNIWDTDLVASSSALQNYGRLCHDVDLHIEAALAETIGTLLLVRIGLSLDHLRLVATSLATLRKSLSAIDCEARSVKLADVQALSQLIVEKYTWPGASVIEKLTMALDEELAQCAVELLALVQGERAMRLAAIAKKLDCLDSRADTRETLPISSITTVLSRKWGTPQPTSLSAADREEPWGETQAFKLK